ncbi:MAG: diacylglycerol kinase family protein [Clostridia bacterium]
MKNEFQKLIKSFAFAYEGITHCIKHERNFRIHLVAVLYVVFFSCLAVVNLTEFAILMLCISQVLSCELINTAIENLCNKDGFEFNSFIKTTKDVSASAVLVSAIACVIIGIAIFAPKTQIIIQNFTLINICIIAMITPICILFIFKGENK